MPSWKTVNDSVTTSFTKLPSAMLLSCYACKGLPIDLMPYYHTSSTLLREMQKPGTTHSLQPHCTPAQS